MCILDDDRWVVVRTLSNVQGNLALVNEYICYRLAEILNLPMPALGMCICDSNTVDTNGLINANNLGYGFCSIYLKENTLLKSGIMKYVVNVDVFYKLVIFDHVVYNMDRNMGNLLVEYKEKNICASVIDHTHVSKNQTIWSEVCFRQGIEERDSNDTSIMEKNDFLYQMFYRIIGIQYNKLVDSTHEICGMITDEVLNDIVLEVPKEWGVSEEDMVALQEYLFYRLSHIDEVCKVIIDYIKA